MLIVSLQRYFIYSLLVHGMVLLLMYFWGQRSHRSPRIPPAVTVEIIETSKENQKLAEDKERRLIVDQERVNEEVDPSAKYLSSHNQKVMKETVAANRGDFQNRKMQGKPRQALQEPITRPKVKVLPKDLFGSYKDSLAKSFDQQRLRDQAGPQSGADVSRTRDYLPDAEKGAETLLSTREFVYYTYYNRIRNQLSQYWEPKIKQKILALFKKGRRIASDKDRITRVQIVLDSEGLLMKVQVMGASGVQDLDDAAVEAFKAAAPFPNPPKGIIEPDGTVKIQWEFVVEA